MKEEVCKIKINKKLFYFPKSSAHDVKSLILENEYALNIELMDALKERGNITIIDIGAGIGTYSFLMATLLKKATIYAYEPMLDSFFYLNKNTKQFKNVKICPKAVISSDKKNMFKGKHNLECCSFFDLGEQKTDDVVEVKTIHPKDLIPNKAEILKIDTEGCEVDILKHINIDNFDIILLEYHSEKDRKTIDRILKNFVLFGAKTLMPQRGVLKYINKRVMKK